MTVWKYRLIYGLQNVPMTEGAEILTAQVQDGAPQLWALLDASRQPQERTILVAATGQTIPPGARYIATFQIDEGTYIFHAFEVIPI